VRSLVMAELLGELDFREALENAMKGTMARDASFSRAWATGKLQRPHFVKWATNHYHYVGPFGDYLGLMYARTPDSARDAKDFLLQNLYEEELSDDRHTDLLIRFAEACGGTRAEVMNRKNALPSTLGIQGWLYYISANEHFAVSTAATIVGLESQVPSIYRTQYPVLIDPNGYGFSEWECEFFDLHITSDEVHGERGYQIVLECANTPELQQRSLQYVRWGAEMRFSYTRALYDTYVAPDLGPSASSGDVLVDELLGSA
jgi:pyrroloquinoline-quinone synthase